MDFFAYFVFFFFLFQRICSSVKSWFFMTSEGFISSEEQNLFKVLFCSDSVNSFASSNSTRAMTNCFVHYIQEAIVLELRLNYVLLSLCLIISFFFEMVVCGMSFMPRLWKFFSENWKFFGWSRVFGFVCSQSM